MPIHLSEAYLDLCLGLKCWRIWTALAWEEFRSNYRRSLLGVIWVTLSFAGFVLLKLTVFTALLSVEDGSYYSAYLLLGYFTWMYISQSINGSPDTFLSNKGWIRSEPLPISIYVYKSILREIFNLLLTSFVVIIAMNFFGYPERLEMIFFSLVAIVFYFFSSVALKIFLGTICLRVRDLKHLVRAIMMPMMFMSPVFWMPSQMEPLMKYLWWNPLFHYIEIFRAPILDGVFPTTSWIFVCISFAIVSVLAMASFALFKRRIVFWL